MSRKSTAEKGRAIVDRLIGLAVMAVVAGGCSREEYDASTPQASLDAMHQMVGDERPGLLVQLIHVEARDITYDDGVTEASAIAEVLDKAGDMLEQLYRVAAKLRNRFPDEVAAEAAVATDAARQRGLFSGDVARFLADPFGLMSEQWDRITAEDLGDGTAAILLDGAPALGGLGVQMRDVDGQWKVEAPIHLLSEYRPETRHEWAVLASLLLSVEHGLDDFEAELDSGRILSLSQAGQRAGRLLGESVVVQAFLYQAMKEREVAPADPSAPNQDEVAESVGG